MAADELHLVGDEVVHIPVGIGAADGKDEITEKRDKWEMHTVGPGIW